MTIRTIELLRGLAAFSVVVAHSDAMLGGNADLPFGRWHDFSMPGTAGVEFFFVLSGFVMAIAHRTDISQGGNIGRFLWRRCCRIYPLYWIVLLIPLHRFWGAPSLTPGAIAAWFSLLPIRTDTILVVAWTLRQEMTFYLMLALCLLPHLGRAILFSWIAVTIAWWTVLPQMAVPGIPGVVLGHVVSQFNFEFFAGLLAGWLLPHLPRRVAFGGALLAAGIVVVAWRMSLDSWGAVYGPVYARAIYGLGYGAVLLGCTVLERNGAVAFGRRGTAVAAAAGAVSYPLYLSHLLAVDQIAAWLGGSGAAARIGPDATVALLLAGSLVAGALLALLVDRPIQRALRHLVPG